jgi:transposase
MHPGHEIGEVFLYREAIDFRKSIDGLAAIVELELGFNLFSGSLFVFTNRHRNKMKILYWNKSGFCLWYKRLEKERFAWMKGDGGVSQSISGEDLRWLIDGLDIWISRPHKTLKYVSNT